MLPNGLGHGSPGVVPAGAGSMQPGVTLQYGKHKGRLLRPQHYTNAVFSDDGGARWHTSAPFPANGTNFPTDPGENIWDVDKLWHDTVRVLLRDGDEYTWHDAGTCRQLRLDELTWLSHRLRVPAQPLATWLPPDPPNKHTAR